MPDESKEEKARKLSAARKKLKEYQRRGAEGHSNINTGESVQLSCSTLSSSDGRDISDPPAAAVELKSVSDSDRAIRDSSSKLNLYVDNTFETGSLTELPLSTSIAVKAEEASRDHCTTIDEKLETVTSVTIPDSYFQTESSTQDTSIVMPGSIVDVLNARKHTSHQSDEGDGVTEFDQNAASVMDMIIKEKASAIENMNKYRDALAEKEKQLQDLQSALVKRSQSFEELQYLHRMQERQMQDLSSKNDALEQTLVQLKGESVDQARHLDELKTELGKMSSKVDEVQRQYQDKCNELEMAKIRIQQLSVEGNTTKDATADSHDQTKLIHEQQIRDLQAMVQHLTQEKEQANLQYQTYVQHLNAQVGKLNERNAELTEECSQLQERERQLVDHIGGLEREIQKSISRREEFKTKEPAESTAELLSTIEKLREQASDFELERHEFQLKIKSQEDRLENMESKLHGKQVEIDALQEQLEQLSMELPDSSKLLATMESDKVAASRALTQNVELKKQLDELELRFVQLTNDKADLTNKLDAEEYANREMRLSYISMEQRLGELEKRFEFKDEEMIRLSHENVQLLHQNDKLKEQLQHFMPQMVTQDSKTHDDGNDHNHHDHNHSHSTVHIDNKSESHGDGVNQHAHHHHYQHDTDHKHEHSEDGCSHELQHNQKDSLKIRLDTDFGVEAKEVVKGVLTDKPYIATEEAVQKLQCRFTQLMTQVADLTDERQRLEHLVTQLQSETETIGEYITLYQTQRRMLKQREYEKAAQMKLLQLEREQLHEKITLLNNLVASLGVEIPKEPLSIPPSTTSENGFTEKASNEVNDTAAQVLYKVDPTTAIVALNSPESKEILTKIHHILTEIKEDTRNVPTVKHAADHLNCCLGKFETV